MVYWVKISPSVGASGGLSSFSSSLFCSIALNLLMSPGRGRVTVSKAGSNPVYIVSTRQRLYLACSSLHMRSYKNHAISASSLGT